MKSVYMVLVCFISSVSGQNKLGANIDSIVFDNPYLQVSQNRTFYAIPNAENIGTRIIAALDKTIVYSNNGNKVLEREEKLPYS